MSNRYMIQDVTLDDAEALGTLRTAVLFDGLKQRPSPYYPADRAHLSTREELLQHTIKSLGKHIGTKGSIYHKVVIRDDPTKTVGFTHWREPESRLDKADIEKAESLPEVNSVPAAIDTEKQKQALAMQSAIRKEVWGEDQNYWYLLGMMVDPNYRRQGIASMLLEYQLARIDEEGLPTYLEATTDGAFLYPHHGFKQVAERVLVEGGYLTKMFVRPAKIH